jgi:hypothetical protein
MVAETAQRRAGRAAATRQARHQTDGRLDDSDHRLVAGHVPLPIAGNHATRSSPMSSTVDRRSPVHADVNRVEQGGTATPARDHAVPDEAIL